MLNGHISFKSIKVLECYDKSAFAFIIDSKMLKDKIDI